MGIVRLAFEAEKKEWYRRANDNPLPNKEKQYPVSCEEELS
jgi:hypothetical protein